MNGRQVTTARRCDGVCDRCRCRKCPGTKSDTCRSIGNARRGAGYIQCDSVGLQTGSQPSAGGAPGHAGTLRPDVAACIDVACADTANLSSAVAAGSQEPACNAGSTFTAGQ